jgi:hypothetical protein
VRGQEILPGDRFEVKHVERVLNRLHGYSDILHAAAAECERAAARAQQLVHPAGRQSCAGQQRARGEELEEPTTTCGGIR